MNEELKRHYIKLRPDLAREDETYAFHIHVDSRELLPNSITESLISAGLTYDCFDQEWAFFGKDGDPHKKFVHFAPEQHMTFVTSNAEKYRQMWRRTVEIVKNCSSKCYIEGELIVLDKMLSTKPFDLEMFNQIAPVIVDGDATSFKYHSAFDGQIRSLPALIKQRRLNPQKNGRRDRFRRGEMHLTLRDSVNKRLLELLCNLGFSVPAIPKLVENGAGGLERNGDGSLLVIRDIPLTLQTTDMRSLMRVANLAVTLVEKIGGVDDGSVKIEFATHFAVLNGVDYNSSIPPVLESVTLRKDFEHLGFNNLGSIEANIANLTQQTRFRVKTAVHEDKIARFKEIWNQEATYTA